MKHTLGHDRRGRTIVTVHPAASAREVSESLFPDNDIGYQILSVQSTKYVLTFEADVFAMRRLVLVVVETISNRTAPFGLRRDPRRGV
jgi:hypothetical protein